MGNKLIYIADDEVNICNIMKSFLVKEDFQVQAFYDGRSLLEAFKKQPADLLVLDIMMPGIDGYSLCTAIRETSNVPIIIVSAKDSEIDRILGLNLGGDDYLTKPFSPMELVARVKSIFRRIELDKSFDNIPSCIIAGDLRLYPERRVVLCKEKPVNFTAMEFNLMQYLLKNKNRAVSREELLNRIWGFETETGTRATDDMIKRVRAKLSDAGSNLIIETVWGFGFYLNVKE
jgi:DNA-binding response OmpR family regulator